MNKDNGKSIIICGVGGQGVVLLGKIMGEYYLKKGYELKVSDIVGLGQRGGSVLCHFRYSEKPVISPLIKAGDADYLISFEQTETLRNLHYIKEDGVVFTSTFEMSSPTVNAGIEKDIYTDKRRSIKESGKKVFIIDTASCNQADVNVSQMMNIITLGFFTGYMGYEENEIMEVMKENINPRFIEGNIKAYKLGRQLFNEQDT